MTVFESQARRVFKRQAVRLFLSQATSGVDGYRQCYKEVKSRVVSPYTAAYALVIETT